MDSISLSLVLFCLGVIGWCLFAIGDLRGWNRCVRRYDRYIANLPYWRNGKIIKNPNHKEPYK